MLNEGDSWSQGSTGGILSSLSPGCCFYFSWWQQHSCTHCKPFLISHTFQHFPFALPQHPLSFLPRVDCVETATGVFPQSCNYSRGKRVILSAYSRTLCARVCVCASVCIWLAPVIFCLFEGFPRCRTKTFPRGVTMCVKVCVRAFQCSLCHCLLR